VKNAPVFAIIAAGGLFGWFAPGLLERAPAEPVAAVAEVEAQERLGVLHEDEWLAGEVVLPRADDGHFYAEVAVDSGSAHMLVDTGATVIALTGEDAEAMGVAWNESEVRPVARGANGTVYGVPVTLEHVQLGEFEARGVPAVVVPEGLGISLLGQSFLSRVERVEIDGDRMLLGG